MNTFKECQVKEMLRKLLGGMGVQDIDEVLIINEVDFNPNRTYYGVFNGATNDTVLAFRGEILSNVGNQEILVNQVYGNFNNFKGYEVRHVQDNKHLANKPFMVSTQTFVFCTYSETETPIDMMLMHNGSGIYPQIGDTVYQMNGSTIEVTEVASRKMKNGELLVTDRYGRRIAVTCK